MPVTKTAGGPTIITPAVALNTLDGQVSGATRDADFAVTEEHDPSIQLQVDLSEADPGATVVLKAASGTTGTVELTLPDTSGMIGGSGDVEGPASSTDNNMPRFDGTSGKTIQASPVSLADDGTMTGVGGLHCAAVIASSAVYTDVIRTGLTPSDEASIQVRDRQLKKADGTVMLDWSSGAAMGASGSFTSNDGKTITVVNGLITAIV